MRMGCATPGVAPLMQSGILADRRLPPMISAFPFVKYNKNVFILFFILNHKSLEDMLSLIFIYKASIAITYYSIFVVYFKK